MTKLRLLPSLAVLAVLPGAAALLFAVVNLAIVSIWGVLAVKLAQENRRLTAQAKSAAA